MTENHIRNFGLILFSKYAIFGVILCNVFHTACLIFNSGDVFTDALFQLHNNVFKEIVVYTAGFIVPFL